MGTSSVDSSWDDLTPIEAQSGAMKEVRQHPRYDFAVPAYFRVLLEEETFTPLCFPGRIINISEGGFLSELDGIDDQQYKIMARRQRFVRVHISIPEAGGETVFLGKAVWHKYHRSRRGGSCVAGVQFDELNEGTYEALMGVLHRLQISVLIATNDAVARKVLETYLQSEGHTVLTADDGGRAWKQIATRYPHIVICDSVLPVMGGMELCHNIKSDHRTKYIYCLMMTDSTDHGDASKAIEAGADAILHKPLDRSQLTDRLCVAVGLAEYHKSLQAAAVKDELTGISNRRAFQAALSREIARARRHSTPLSLAVLDVNGFKKINDIWGHDRGDEVLRHVASQLTDVLGYEEAVFRIGGDEFAILVPETEKGMAEIVDRLKERFVLRDTSQPVDPDHPTLSVGQSSFSTTDTPESLFRRADEQMYKDKRMHHMRGLRVRLSEE